MACTNQALANITRPCSNVGGIFTEVYVALREKLDTVTFVETEEPKNTISSITLKDSAKWNVFQFGKNSSSFTSTAQYDGKAKFFMGIIIIMGIIAIFSALICTIAKNVTTSVPTGKYKYQVIKDIDKCNKYMLDELLSLE